MATTSPLRQRMIEDMTIRNLSQATQQSHIYAVTAQVEPDGGGGNGGVVVLGCATAEGPHEDRFRVTLSGLQTRPQRRRDHVGNGIERIRCCEMAIERRSRRARTAIRGLTIPSKGSKFKRC